METLTIEDMMGMQARLQEKYKRKWDAVSPENAHRSLLWAVGEMGEVIDVFKKRGYQSVLTDRAQRVNFMEETVDVMMYLWDMLACMGITPQEFSEIYAQKHAFNMRRTYGKDKFLDEQPV